jgi:hypothetical protein
VSTHINPAGGVSATEFEEGICVMKSFVLAVAAAGALVAAWPAASQPMPQGMVGARIAADARQIRMCVTQRGMDPRRAGALLSALRAVARQAQMSDYVALDRRVVDRRLGLLEARLRFECHPNYHREFGRLDTPWS